MLPIVNKDVEGSKVSIYNADVQAKHPLLGLKFKNTTGLHLTQGPITVFEGSVYAGDTRVLDLQPERGTAGQLRHRPRHRGRSRWCLPRPDRLTKVKINKGIIQTTTRVVDKKTYNIKNRTENDRLVLIEHPFRPEFKLKTTEKPASGPATFIASRSRSPAASRRRRKWSRNATC